MYKFLLWHPGYLLLLLISAMTQAQNNPQTNKNIPDTIHHGLILEEVVIKASPKILVKRDTVLFSADAFMDNSVKVVEQLLKKLPGIDIAKNGTITMNGKRVERILIEGDDILKQDYAILSRNLSADIIDEVQVIDNYTSSALLKGLVGNDNKVINLTLKDKRKKMLFGDITAGVGNSTRKDISLNLMSLLNRKKIYFLGNYNTTGRNIVPGISEQGGIEGIENNSGNTDNTTPGIINIFRLHRDESGAEKINFNNAKLFSLFVSQNPSPNLTVRFSGWSFLDHSCFTQLNDYRYYIKDSTIDIYEHNFYNKKPVSVTGNIDILYKYSKRSEIKLSSVFISSASTATGNVTTDNSFYYNKLKENRFRFHNTIAYTQRINKASALMIEAAYIHNESRQKLAIDQTSPRELPFTDLFPRFLDQSVSYPLNTTALSCHYIHTKNSWRVNIDIGYTLRNLYLHSSLDTSSSIQQTSISDRFLNEVRLKRHTSTAGLSLLRQIRKLQLTATITANLLQNGHPITTNFIYPSAGIGMNRKTGKHLISAGYSYDNKFPAITDMSEGYILTDYRSFQRGTKFFTNRPVHTGSIGYTYSYPPGQLFFHCTASVFRMNNIPGSNMQLLKEYDIIDLASVGSSITYYLYDLGIDKYINALAGGLKIKTSISVNRYQDRLNDPGSRQINALASTTQLSFRSVFKGAFNYNVGTIVNYSRSKVESSQGSALRNVIVNNFLDLQLRFSNKVYVRINNEHYYFREINKGKKSYYFINLSLQYELIKSKVSLTLTGRNLTNNKKYINTQASDFSVQMQQYNLIPLYVLTQINYRF